MYVCVEIAFILLHITFSLLAILFLCLSTQKKQQIKSKRAKLPPGSMGWPYVGETLQLYSQDPNTFFASKQKRYGEIFKTHVLGCPSVMLASPEGARFVLVTHSHLFKPTYPKGKEKIIGPSALFFHHGDYHACMRKLVQSSLSLDNIRRLIPDIINMALSILDSSSNGKVINTFYQMKKFSFDVGILSILGHLDSSYRESIEENYNIVDKGYNCFPTNIRGSAYHKAFQARKRLLHIMSEIICERREKKLLGRDLLGQLLNFKDEKGQILSEDQIADNIIGVLFAAQDTTASALTWILKYLYDDQKLLQAVKAEQMAIFEANDGGRKPITWSQTKNMPLTYRVVLESLRMASIISFTFREAVVDVEYKGFLIPKGWKVMPLFRSIHHNPDFFPDPLKFDPCRFEDSPRPNTFMPFGSGIHACPGNELAKLEMLIMLHYLVTNFRWEVVGSKRGIQYGPFPVPQDGLQARFWKETNRSPMKKLCP